MQGTLYNIKSSSNWNLKNQIRSYPLKWDNSDYHFNHGLKFSIQKSLLNWGNSINWDYNMPRKL